MTRDEILKLEAGRELDALIAEKVMGWDFSSSESRIRLCGYLVDIGERVWTAPNGDTYASFDLPNFSTGIAAAWEVVERVTQTTRYTRADMHYNRRYRFGFWDDHKLGQVGEAETAPLAICRAALLAVMECQ